MVVNSRIDNFQDVTINNYDNGIYSNEELKKLKNDYIIFGKMIQTYSPILKSLLKMYSCEKCGECCRTEKVLSGKTDMHKLMRFDILMFHRAVDEIRGGNLFKLRVPCYYLDDNNKCSCNAVKPQPCKLYPFIFLYGYFISISYCPYGKKIINDIMDFCKTKNIKTQTIAESDNIEMKDVITRIDKFYSDAKLNNDSSDDKKILNVPFDILEDFYVWFQMKRKKEIKNHNII